MPSALDRVRAKAVVDLDQPSLDIAARLGPFCDMTSNQALLAWAITQPENTGLVRDVVDEAKATAATTDETIELALDLLVVRIAQSILPHLTGRVHAQLSPRFVDSYDLSLAHARRLIALFDAHGIPSSRVCLKIPSNGPGLAVAATLEAERAAGQTGARTLATILFSVDQALAARQAGCLYIAPYFNQLSVHFEPETWVEYADTAREHPSSAVIRAIARAYESAGERPLIMPASIVTATEALAIATLPIDHITISGTVLEALAADNDAAAFDSAELGIDVPRAEAAGGTDAHSADFLADHGKALDESIAADESVARRFAYAVRAFADCEQRVIQAVRAQL
ncbi:hypothetical protein Q5752_005569 [Cryptotrichosporon argae]